VPLDQVIAIGDGANDLLMLQKAGHGIAFHAKPKLREAAHTSISAMGLDAILYLLGITGRDVRFAGARMTLSRRKLLGNGGGRGRPGAGGSGAEGVAPGWPSRRATA